MAEETDARDWEARRDLASEAMSIAKAFPTKPLRCR